MLSLLAMQQNSNCNRLVLLIRIMGMINKQISSLPSVPLQHPLLDPQQY